MNDAILNEGLKLAMEFGKTWLQPIQGRLGRQHSELSKAELDEYERVCREALKFGLHQVRVQMKAAERKESEARPRFDEVVKELYPWMSADCLGHLFSQGCYYAWKDGEL